MFLYKLNDVSNVTWELEIQVWFCDGLSVGFSYYVLIVIPAVTVYDLVVH